MDLLTEALARARDRRRLPSPAQRRRIRTRAGLPLAAVASAVGVSIPSLSRWESGQRVPRGDRLRRYLDVLDQLCAEAER